MDQWGAGCMLSEQITSRERRDGHMSVGPGSVPWQEARTPASLLPAGAWGSPVLCWRGRCYVSTEDMAGICSMS